MLLTVMLQGTRDRGDKGELTPMPVCHSPWQSTQALNTQHQLLSLLTLTSLSSHYIHVCSTKKRVARLGLVTPAVPALRRVKQENFRFNACLGYRVTPMTLARCSDVKLIKTLSPKKREKGASSLATSLWQNTGLMCEGPVSIPVTANESEPLKDKGLFPSLSPPTANSRNDDHGLLQNVPESYGF